MSLFDRLISILAPHECLVCGAEGSLLCAICTKGLEPAVERCYRCHKLSTGALTCSSCRKLSQLHSVWAARAYEGVAKDLVWKLKFAGAQAAARLMVEHMLPGLLSSRMSIVVPVPTATSRARQRGYDQAELLARELAQKIRQHYIACLARTNQTHQVGSTREQRFRQLTAAFRTTKSRPLRGQHIILVDDVVTTGATLEAAAAALRAAGAGRIDAVVFAQA